MLRPSLLKLLLGLQYVATYTENNMDGPKLEEVYNKIRKSKHMGAPLATYASATSATGIGQQISPPA